MPGDGGGITILQDSVTSGVIVLRTEIERRLFFLTFSRRIFLRFSVGGIFQRICSTREGEAGGIN